MACAAAVYGEGAGLSVVVVVGFVLRGILGGCGGGVGVETAVDGVADAVDAVVKTGEEALAKAVVAFWVWRWFAAEWLPGVRCLERAGRCGCHVGF